MLYTVLDIAYNNNTNEKWHSTNKITVKINKQNQKHKSYKYVKF